MSPGGGALRRRFLHSVPVATILVAICFGLLPAPEVGAQEPDAILQLVRQPTWHTPGDDLGTVIQVTNAGDTELRGYEIRVRVYSPVEGRIQLHESFNGVEEVETFSRLGPRIPPLEPGASTRVGLEDRIANLGLTADGVYPMTLSLVDQDLVTELGEVTTQIVFYASQPEDPLKVVPVVPLSSVAFKSPAGGLAVDEDGRPLVAKALDQGSGWLAGVLAALQEASPSRSPRDLGLSGGLAPSARLLEELEDVAENFSFEGEDAEAVRGAARAALDDISSLLSTGRMQPLFTTYAAVDLPTVTARFDQENLNRQLSEASVVLDETMPDVQFDPRWFFAPGLRWDEESLADVRIAGSHNADHTFFTRHAISGSEDAGCPDVNRSGFAFACPVEIVTEGRSVTGFVADPAIQERLVALTERGQDRLDLQRLFAETAMIHLEQPGTAERVVQLSVPGQLHPTPYLSTRLFTGLARAPWLTPLKPSEGLEAGRQPERRDLTTVAPTLPEQPDEDYFAAISEASEAVRRFEEIGPPAARLRRLHRNILEGQSRVWWSDQAATEGIKFALATQREAEGQLANITVEGLDTTLTSQAAPIEMTVFNNNTYPVTIDVELSSENGDITIQRDDLDDLQDLTIGPEDNEQITVDAEAQSSGIFRLSALLKTPQNGYDINEETITIRSTNFNRIALTLTFGALAFLVLFYLWRWFNRRSRGTETSEQAST
jgi:hypothetical protein